MQKMNKTERTILADRVSSMLNDSITAIFEKVLAEYHLDITDLEVGFPYDGDIDPAFEEIAWSTTGILADTIALHTVQEKEDTNKTVQKDYPAIWYLVGIDWDRLEIMARDRGAGDCEIEDLKDAVDMHLWTMLAEQVLYVAEQFLLAIPYSAKRDLLSDCCNYTGRQVGMFGANGYDDDFLEYVGNEILKTCGMPRIEYIT